MTPHTARLLFVPTEGGFARYLGEIRQPPMLAQECPPTGSWRERGEPPLDAHAGRQPLESGASVAPGGSIMEMLGEEIKEDPDFRREMTAMGIDGVDR